MKNFILLFLACVFILGLSSCKKTYTCTCNTTYTFKNNSGGYTSVIIPADKTPYSQKMTEKQAREACRHEQVSIQTNFTNGITGDGYYPLLSGESIDTSCGITL